MADVYSNHVGTTADSWQLGGDGPQLKRVGDFVELRNGADTEPAILRGGQLNTARVDSDVVVPDGFRFVIEDLELADGVTLEVVEGGGLVVL